MSKPICRIRGHDLQPERHERRRPGAARQRTRRRVFEFARAAIRYSILNPDYFGRVIPFGFGPAIFLPRQKCGIVSSRHALAHKIVDLVKTAHLLGSAYAPEEINATKD
jgi:hypothetical protein